jgi:Ca-activated chloride channel homolog
MAEKWASARPPGSSTNYRVVVSQGPMAASVQAVARRTAFSTALQGIPVEGQSCLYNTVAAAHFAVSSRGSDERLNAVILLTDGRNELADGIKLPELLKLIEPPSATETTPAKVRTPIITIALGPKADQVSLAKIAAASGGVAYVAKDTAALPGVYLAAISNVQ